MDTRTQRQARTVIRQNQEFSAFVQMLPTVCRSKFREELEQKIPSHNIHQFKNWKAGRSAIPIPYYKVVNETAGEVLMELLVSFIPHLADEAIRVNLFEIKNKMEVQHEKTTIWFERHRLRWTQEELATKAGLSSATISAFENMKAGDGFMMSTARKIATALGKKVFDFEEFNE